MARLIVSRIRSFQTVPIRLRSTATAEELRDAVEESTEWEKARPYSSIPGPTSSKILGPIGSITAFLPGGIFANKTFPEIVRAVQKEYGPIARLPGILGRPDVVMISNAEDIKQVFRSEGHWPSRTGAASLEYYFRNVRKDRLISLVVAQGEEWQTFRSAVNQVMMQPRNTKQYAEPIDKVTEDFLDRIREIRDEKDQLPDSFFDEISKWSLESITYVALDTRLGLFHNKDPNSEAVRMMNSTRSLFEGMYKLDFRPSPWQFISTPAFRQFVSSMEFFTEIATKYVTAAMDRLQKVTTADLEDRPYSVLESLLLRNDNPNVAVSMALDMLLAGVETTSTVSSTVLYQLATNPAKQRILQAELDRVIPDPSKPLTNKQLEEARYMKACIKEAMRMMPILPGTGRNAGKDMVIQGYQVPKGTMVSINYSVMGGDERYFPRPSEFLPERWLPGNDDIKQKHPFAFLPFGFGPRSCVGKRFADLEIETIVAKVFRNFDVQWEHPPVETDFKMLLTFKTPLKFTVKDRK